MGRTTNIAEPPGTGIGGTAFAPRTQGGRTHQRREPRHQPKAERRKAKGASQKPKAERRTSKKAKRGSRDELDVRATSYYHRNMLYLTPPEELAEELPGEPGYRVAQLREWLYDHPTGTTELWSNFPKELRERLAPRLWPFKVEIEQTADKGATVKWLFRTPDGISIESVLMGYHNRATLCVSSQAGCAMACTFCATGQFGFDRHLDAGEIVAQVAFANAFIRSGRLTGVPSEEDGGPTRVSNIVFMGMGEPLANYPRVRESLRRMNEIMGIGARSITVSTVGVVPGMRRLAEEPWQVGLAVSLHAADDELRSKLVPLNERYPLAEVEAAAAYYFEKKGRRVSIEWTMMDGVNDTHEQAEKLSAIARRLHAHVNLINLNPTPLSDDKPSRDRAIKSFMRVLESNGVPVTLRDTRGRDIDAACGQLRVHANTPVELTR
jgi:23S rRNA (adenine2503-C2)-methyltransferase